MPTYRKLPIEDLMVDHRYQRPIKERLVQKMEEDWDEVMQSVLEVSQRDSGEHAVFDGQQRLEGARRRIAAGTWEGPEVLPCLLHVGLTPQQEAALFARLQDERVPITPLEKFKSRVFGGDPIAVEIQTTAEEHGFGIGSNSGELQAIVQVERTHRQRGNLGRTLDKIKIWRGDRTFNTIAVSAGFIEGISRFLDLYPEADDTRIDESWGAESPVTIERRTAEYREGIRFSKGQAVLRVLRDLYHTTKTWPLPTVDHALERKRLEAAKVHRRYRRVDYAEFRDAVLEMRDFSIDEMKEKLGVSTGTLTKKPEGFIPTALERGMLKRYRPGGGLRGSFRYMYVPPERQRRPARRSTGGTDREVLAQMPRNGGPVKGTGKGKKLTNPEIRELVQELKNGNPGVIAEPVASGHVEVSGPDLPRVLIPNTPSDSRSVLTAKSRLRRAGYKV